MINTRTAAKKGGKAKVGKAASQGKGAEIKHVDFGKKKFRLWNLGDPIRSSNETLTKRFRTYGHWASWVTDEISNGKTLRELSAQLAMTSSRLYEAMIQMGLNLDELKRRAKGAKKGESD